MLVNLIPKGIGATIETNFLGGRPSVALLQVRFTDENDSLVTLVAAGLATVDPVSTTLAQAAAAKAQQLTLTSATGVVVGRRYKIGTAGSAEADENVTVKSINGNVVTLWSPLFFAHSSGAAFSGLRVSYAIAASLTANAEENLGYWVNGTAVWTPATQLTPTVSGATNANPIVVQTSVAHGLNTGDVVSIVGCLGNTAANGLGWIVTLVDPTHFSISAQGNGNYTGGGNLYTASDTPQTEIVHCVKFPLPVIACDLHDIRQVYPKMAQMLDPELDIVDAIASARDKMLLDLGGERILYIAGTEDLRHLAAMRFWLDREQSLGKNWKDDIKSLRDRYEATIVQTRHYAPADLDKDGRLNEAKTDLFARMGSV